jgi:aspartyl aminopeptidase
MTSRLLAISQQVASRAYSSMPPVSTKAAANDFLNFVNASPTPFHAVRSVKEKLNKAGFKEIKVRRYIQKVGR